MSIAIAQEFDTADVLAPERPLTLADSGLSRDTLTSLIVKSLHGGEASGMDLADRIRLPYAILEPLLEHLRVEMLVQVKSAAGMGTAGYRYTLTDAGRDRAHRYFEACGYVGPAPVPVAQYQSYMGAIRAQTRDVFRERVAGAFSHLIVEPEMLDQLGPGDRVGPGDVPLRTARKRQERHGRRHRPRAWRRHLRAARASTSTGRSSPCSIPSRTRRTITATKARSSDRTATSTAGGFASARPVITVGGELTLEMLDLRYKELSAFYEAPVHLKANGGVLVVDDFGRQRVPARDLLNRWIVPLESRVDYLNLVSGRKFQVPFDVMVVFATNLEPRSLADEAFLRRIPYKILAKNPIARAVLQDLRDELQAPQADLRSVDRPAPERQVLHRPQTRHARVSSARSHRSGRQPVPVSPASAGADAPRSSTRCAAPISSQTRKTWGRLRDDGHGPRLSPRACENWSRIFVGTLFFALAWRLLGDFIQTNRATDLLLLVGEALVVVLTCLRRPASVVDRRPVVRLVTAVSMTFPLLSEPAHVAPIIPEAAAAMLLGLGLLVVVGGKISLGYSFGLLPANRGVMERGLYRLVRHPDLSGLPADAHSVSRRPSVRLERRRAARRRRRPHHSGAVRRGNARPRPAVRPLLPDSEVAHRAWHLLNPVLASCPTL